MKYVILVALLAFAAAKPQKKTPRWNEEGCGTSATPPPESYIVGGQDAVPNQFPWQVSVQNLFGSHFCGATVATSRWIICAAHCTEGNTPSSIQVVVGEHHRTNNDGTEQTLQLSQIHNHEDFNFFTLDYDMSLLYTSQDIDIDYTDRHTVYPACEPLSGPDFDDKPAFVSGWGTLTSGGAILPQTLQWVQVPILPQDDCIDRYGSQITPRMICAGNKFENEHDACQGDSGGPLVVKNDNNEYELVGVVSWGIGCASGYPGVYARVTEFKDWMDEIMA